MDKVLITCVAVLIVCWPASGRAESASGSEGAARRGATAGRPLAEVEQPAANGPPVIQLRDVGTSVPGVRLDGAAEGNEFGSSLSGAGDVNGDGLSDVIVGAHFASRRRGRTYVVHGPASGIGTSGVLNVATLDGTNGTRLDGQDIADFSGTGTGGSDLNGDGFADVLVGVPGGDRDSLTTASGETYLLFGSPSGIGTDGVANLNWVNLGAIPGIRLDGAAAYDRSGRSVSGAGDVNADGFPDILVGAYMLPPDGHTSPGKTYLIYGSPPALGANRCVDLSSLDEAEGVRIHGIGDRDNSNSGWSVSGAGDVNGDGFDDFLIGASYAHDRNLRVAGEAYLIYGSEANIGSTGTLDLAALDGTNGVRIPPLTLRGRLGYSVSGAGDVNGDGFADFLIGAPQTSSPRSTLWGETYLIYGSASGISTTGVLDLGTLDGVNGVRLRGIDQGDQSGNNVSGAGDVNGDGFADLLIGAPGGDPGGNHEAGESYLVFGSASGIGTTGVLDLATLDGTNGARLDGIDPYDYSGDRVSGAGDVNGDGFADFLIGAYRADAGSTDTGEAYLVFGTGTATSATYKAYIRSGNAPKRWIGVVCDGRDDGRGDSRCAMDFGDGQGATTSGASLQTVTVHRCQPSGSGLPTSDSVARVFWRVRTDRTGWAAAHLTFQYCDHEVAGFDESTLHAFEAPTPAGPWSAVVGVAVDTRRNQVSFLTGSADAAFALGSLGNRPPDRPLNVSPAHGTTNVLAALTLASSPFSDPDTTSTHAASEWEISTNPYFATSPPLVWSSGVTPTDLVSIGVPPGVLNDGAGYYWRVRHLDNVGTWSEWSVATFFRVALPADTQTPGDKAVICAGGGNYFGNSILTQTNYLADYAFRMSLDRGFTSETIYYLNADTSQIHDADGDGVDDTDAPATIANLQWAVSQWPSDAARLFVYLVDHASPSQFQVNETELLDSATFDSWLDTLQNDHGTTVIVVADCCYSGNFIPTCIAPPGATRAVFTSAGTDELAVFLAPYGYISFSNFFLGYAHMGANLFDCFAWTRDALHFTYAGQTPRLDDTGDGLSDKNDGYLALTQYWGHSYGFGVPAPVITSVAPPHTLPEVTSATFWCEVAPILPVTRVWVTITTPGMAIAGGEPITDLLQVELHTTDTTTYAGSWDGFVQNGEYAITYFAVDTQGHVSWPRRSSVTKMWGPDEYEVDDAAGQASPIVIDWPAPQQHNFHDAGDQDWVYAFLLGGGTYRFVTEDVETSCDLVVEIYDSTTAPVPVVVKDDYGFGLPETFQWNCPTSQTYYILAYGSDGLTHGEGTSYSLKLESVSGANNGLATALSGFHMLCTWWYWRPDVVGYDLLRTTDLRHDEWVQVNLNDIPSTTVAVYHDHGVLPLTTYYYKVEALFTDDTSRQCTPVFYATTTDSMAGSAVKRWKDY